MEELLNKLIKKGWKPRGIYTSIIGGYGLVRCEEYVGSPRNERKSYRELVSNESGLWQFVCENGMIKNANDYSWELYNGGHGQYEVYKNGYEGGKRWEQVDYEYRLIESALKDEEDLEKFLLDNIKIS